MILTGRFQLLNTDVRSGVKDPNKNYNVVLLMQGTDTIQCMCEDSVLFEKLRACKQLAELDIHFVYNAKYGSLRIQDVTFK